MKITKKELRLKVYKVRFDCEDKNGYFQNMTSYNILAETFTEAIEEAKKRLSKKDIKENYVIGEVELLCEID